MKCKKWIALLLAVAMTIAVTGCGKDEGGGTGKDDVVATIEDTSITNGQLDEFVKLSAYVAQQDMTSFEAQPELLNYLKKAMLTNMVSYEAMRLTLEEEGVEIFPADYDAKLKEFLASGKDGVKELGISEETLTHYFNLNFYATPFNEDAEKAVTDAEVRAYYDEHIADRYTLTAARAEVSHILPKDEATANEVYDKIAGGADFAEMAAEYGTDGTKDIGGSLGVLMENDPNYDADFMKGAFALKSGEVSKPVKTSFGFHIIKLGEREEAGTVIPFEEETDSIRSNLITTKYNEVVTELVGKYKIEYFGAYADDAAGTGAGTGDEADKAE